MSAPAVEIVAPPDATNDAMIAATEDALPANARVRIVERASSRADVIVSLQWADAQHRQARLFVRTNDGRTAERTLTFDAADPPRERGRALGFAVAAMIPEDLRTEDEAAPPPPAPPAPQPKEAGPSGLSDPETKPVTTVMSLPNERVAPQEATTALRRTVWLDASAQGGVGGSAGGIGGALAGRLAFEHVALRVGGAVRAGSVDEASASSTVWRGDGGIAFFTVLVDPRLLVGARAGVVVLHHALVRTEENGVRTSGTHTLLGVEVIPEVSFAFSSRFAAIAAAGTEVAFGQTAVVVGDARVTVLPPIRAVFEAGARFAF